MVGSQIVNLTCNLSFGHNLCFRCPNGSCKPILDIYILIAFQSYKELFNPLSFDPCNRFLNIQKSSGIPTPNVRVPLGVWGSIPSHSLALLGACTLTPRLPSWPATLQALALVMSPRLRLRHSLNGDKLWAMHNVPTSKVQIVVTWDSFQNMISQMKLQWVQVNYLPFLLLFILMCFEFGVLFSFIFRLGLCFLSICVATFFFKNSLCWFVGAGALLAFNVCCYL